ncbi:hypothetical protein NKR23_g8783 [Pleurostoma richardsiae]|uniref:Uncharacterized protein n=1 Tax=Pleurostoma richardsiae TaxID=41990 RepID=A0AA38VKX1_9PEZI|nr:hypothetical protein NKR23_g8783 [Pleurostoma richardsiae]
MLVWIAYIDSAAASSGTGGHFNRSLIIVLSEAARCEDDDPADSILTPELSTTISSPVSPIDAFMRMHRYSNPLYRLAWGEAYPQTELLDDLENRSVFNLITCCSPLRFMVAQLAATNDITPHEFHKRVASVAKAIQKTRSAFAEILEVARELSIETDSNNRLVANIRNIVPIFYAIQLEFLRITEPDSPLGQGKVQRFLLKEIMNLAFQTFRYRGEDGLTRIAWPLFIAALETDNPLDRAWIIERFEKMSILGRHLRGAHRFIGDVVAIQEMTMKRVNTREMMRSRESFILT